MKLNRLEPLAGVPVREYGEEVEVSDDTMKGYTFGKGKKSKEKGKKSSAKGKKSGKAPPWK